MQAGDDGDGEEEGEDALGGKGEGEPIGGFPRSDEKLWLIVGFSMIETWAGLMLVDKREQRRET